VLKSTFSADGNHQELSRSAPSVPFAQRRDVLYGYDANGNLTSVTDSNNYVTSYGYDAANRKDHPDAAARDDGAVWVRRRRLLGAVDAPDVSPMFQWCVAMVGGGWGRGKGERNWEKKLSNSKKERSDSSLMGVGKRRIRKMAKGDPARPPPLKEL
jgi:hypothetical protein